MNAQPGLCPSDDILAAYGLGKADGRAADTVVAHLETCPDCRRRVAGLSADDFLGRLRDAARPGPDSTAEPNTSLSGLSRVVPAGTPAAADLPPELTASGQYADVRVLGAGGMGVVYLARNVLMDRDEVLKVVGRSLLAKPGAADRFLREIRSAGKLSHQNVVTAYTAHRLGDTLVFAMEYVPGDDLTKVVQARGPLPVHLACGYAYHAALGLQHAHERGMVHRDIKPSNLILTKSGGKPAVKVLDFGLAKATSEKEQDAGLTGAGQMMGTPDYMAPEQARDAARADIRADVYSLGCTLYFLLTGRPPFAGGSLYEVLRAHQETPPPPLDAARPDVPGEVVAAVRRMMAKDPAARFPTPGEVAKVLAPFVKPGSAPAVVEAKLVSPPATTTAPPPPPPAWRPPTVFRNEAVPQHTRHVNPEDFDPPARPKPKAKRKAAPARKRPAWRIPTAVAGAVVLAVVAALAGGVFKARTPNGTIVVENVPADATVEVNGETVTVSRDGDTVTLTALKDGPYKLKVKSGDRELKLSDAEVTVGGKPVRVRVEPAANPPAGKPGPAGAEFVSLFNGKDLAGWKTHPKQPGGWAVEGGVLVGKGPAVSHLYTGADDYADVHVRAEVMVNAAGNSGLYVRSQFGPTYPADTPRFLDGYEAQINVAGKDPNRTGSLYAGAGGAVAKLAQPPARADQWFVLELIAEDNRVTVLVDGKETARYTDDRRQYRKGHVALQMHDAQTEVRFRKIEVKRLGPPPVGPKPAPPVVSRFADGDADGWTVSQARPAAAPRVPARVEKKGTWWAVRADDEERGPSFGWHAPAKFHGDHSAFFGRDLTYRLWVSHVDQGEEAGVGAAVRITGGGLAIRAGSPRPAPAAGRWVRPRFKLDESAGWVTGPPKAERPATAADIRKVLGAVEDLRILGEYSNEKDHAFLADVEFGADEAKPAGATDPPPGPADRRGRVSGNGTWRRDGDELVLVTDRRGSLQFGDPRWADYTFAAEVRTDDGTGPVSALVRCGKGLFSFGHWFFTARTEVWPDGGSPEPGSDPPRFRVEPGRWYRVAVAARGNDYQCDLAAADDGKGPAPVRVTRTDARNPAGRVGLAAGGQGKVVTYRFRNLKVTAPDGTVLWEGLPDLPGGPKAEGPPAADPVAFSDITGATPDELRKWAAALPPGQRPVWVAARAGTDAAQFDAVAVPDPNAPPWKLLVRESEAELQSDSERLHGEGYSPEFIAPFPDGDVYLWSKEGEPNHWLGGADYIAEKLGVAKAARAWPLSVGASRKGGGVGHKLTFEYRHRWLGAPDFEWHPALTPEELGRKVGDARRQGWRPRLVSAHVGRPELRYYAVFAENVPPVAWDFSPRLAEDEYRAALADRRAAGQRPQCVSSAVVDGEVGYTVVWVADPFQGVTKGALVPAAEARRQAAACNRFHVAEGATIRNDGGELVVEGGPNWRGWFFFGDPDWTDYDFAARVKFPGKVDGATLFVRVNHEYDGRRRPDGLPSTERVMGLFPFAFADNSVIAVEGWRDWTGFIGDGLPRDEKPGLLKADTWYAAVVKVRGDTVETYLDGKLVHRAKPPMPARGGVGVRAVEEGPVRFADLKVTAPDGKVLWEGLPELPD